MFKRNGKKAIDLRDIYVANIDDKDGGVIMNVMTKKKVIKLKLDPALVAGMFEEIGNIAVGFTKKDFEAKDQMYR